eukprot:scaffold8737_cov124-Isochrysis_galbana.AAC.6
MVATAFPTSSAAAVVQRMTHLGTPSRSPPHSRRADRSHAALLTMFAGRLCLQGDYVCRATMFAGRLCLQGDYVCRATMFVGRLCLQGDYVCRAMLSAPAVDESLQMPEPTHRPACRPSAQDRCRRGGAVPAVQTSSSLSTMMPGAVLVPDAASMTSRCMPYTKQNSIRPTATTFPSRRSAASIMAIIVTAVSRPRPRPMTAIVRSAPTVVVSSRMLVVSTATTVISSATVSAATVSAAAVSSSAVSSSAVSSSAVSSPAVSSPAVTATARLRSAALEAGHLGSEHIKPAAGAHPVAWSDISATLCWAAATIPAAVTAAAAAVLAAVAAPISPAVATIIAAVATTAVAVGGPRGAALRERWPGVLSYRNAQATISHLLVVAARDRGLRLLLRGVADKSEAARLADDTRDETGD